jgi:hypothetical protein
MKRPLRTTLCLSLFGLLCPAVSGQASTSLEALAPPSSIGSSLGLQPVEDGLIGGAASYEARFDDQGFTFVASLGRQAPFEHSLRLEAVSIEQGGVRRALVADEPEARGLTAVYERGFGVREEAEVRQDGLEHSFVVAGPLADGGDLCLVLALEGELAHLGVRLASGAHSFRSPYGGVDVGALTVLDAAGRSVKSDVRLEDGSLVLSAPAAFLAEATWPVTLDPLIGSGFAIDGSTTWDDGKPDVSWDASWSQYLVVWRREFSATSHGIRGQRLNQLGAPIGGTVFFSSGTGTMSAPRVADANFASRFVVVWQQEVGSLFGDISQVVAQAFDPGIASLSGTVVLDSAGPGDLSSPDVGGEVLKSPYRQAVVVWDREGTGIRGAKLDVDVSGTPALLSVFGIAADVTGFSVVSSPTITRNAGNAGVYAVVYLRTSPLILGDSDVHGVLLDRDGAIIGASAKLYESVEDELPPDVDGGSSATAEFVAAFVSDGTNDRLLAVPFKLGTAANIEVQPWQVLSEIASKDVLPIVAFDYWKVLVGYGLPGPFSSELMVVGLDPHTCLTCEDPYSVSNDFGLGSMAIAPIASGGNYENTEALAVFSFDDSVLSAQGDILGQRLDFAAHSGTAQDIGGGCGLGGNALAQGTPDIGNGSFALEVGGADPLATLTILNIGLPTGALACGPCQWVPFLLDFPLPMTAGAAAAVVGIPCDTNLVGAVVDAQWTVISPSSSPCVLYPSVSLSNRLRITVGI